MGKNMLQVCESELDEEELNDIIDAIKNGCISSIAKYIPEFEDSFSKCCGCKDGIK